MSFDLFVFEKRKEIKTSLDVFAYQEDIPSLGSEAA